MLLPAVLQGAIVAAFGSRMFLYDEFYYVRAFREIGEGKPWLHWIWLQHNEHRIVWTKLLFFAHAGFSGWNPLVDMYVSALLTALIAWGIWKLYRAAGPGHPAYFIPVALLLCSLAQYMNMLYGLMTCHYFTMAGMIWTLVFLLRRTWTALAAAIVCAFAALVSTLNAIVIAPIGLLVLVMTRQKPARWIAWSAAMLGCGYAYFRRYQRPGQIPAFDWSSATAIRQAADTFLVNLGSPLSATDIAWSRALGVMTAGALVVLWLGVWRLGKRESHAGLVALSLIAVGSAAAVATGAQRPEHDARVEYVAYATFGLVAPYLGLAVARPARAPRDPRRLTAVIGVRVAANRPASKAHLAATATARLHAADDQMQPDENVASIYAVAGPAMPPRICATRLGPFRNGRRADGAPLRGLPTGAITPARPAGAPSVRRHARGRGPRRPPSPGRGGTGSAAVSLTAGERVVGRGRIERAT